MKNIVIGTYNEGVQVTVRRALRTRVKNWFRRAVMLNPFDAAFDAACEPASEPTLLERFDRLPLGIERGDVVEVRVA
jgi:hypothetical protein